MDMMNLIDRFRSLPLITKRTLSIGAITGMFIALPLFVWAIVTQRFDTTKHAASGEPGVCIAVNKVIRVTDPYGSDDDSGCHGIQLAINAVDGDGYTILIGHGDYNITQTINIANKHNLKIEGNVEGSWDEVWLSFNTTNGGGWGIKVTNSSGSIERLHAEGITPNGLLSIQNSNNFAINRAYLFGTSSHTLDIQNSGYVEINDSEIRSSAGAIEIDQSHNVYVSRNKIHDASTGISASNSTYVTIMDNLLTANSGGAIRIWNVPNTGINHNTIANNVGSSPTVDISGNNPTSSFSQNIVAFNTGAGVVREANATTFSTISYNDVFSNYAGANYSNMTNPTGSNGNISADPFLNASYGYYCLLNGSPAVYGSISGRNYMGHAGPCSTSTPPGTPNTNPPTCSQSSIAPETGGAPLEVTLFGSGGSGNGVGIDGYQWDFENDGVWDTNISIDPQHHVYLQPGTHHPVYRVHNINNIWSSTCDYPYPIVVENPNPTSSPTPVVGDVNADGHVNIIDIGILIDNYRMAPPNNPAADLNNDGVVNIVDIGIIVDHYEF